MYLYLCSVPKSGLAGISTWEGRKGKAKEREGKRKGRQEKGKEKEKEKKAKEEGRKKDQAPFMSFFF